MRPLVLAVVALLVLAGTAHAAEATAETTPTTTPSGGTETTTTTPAEPTGQPATGVPVETPVEVKTGGETPPAGSEQPATESTPPPTETTPPPKETTPPPAETTPPPAETPAAETPHETAPPPPPPPPPAETPPTELLPPLPLVGEGTAVPPVTGETHELLKLPGTGEAHEAAGAGTGNTAEGARTTPAPQEVAAVIASAAGAPQSEGTSGGPPGASAPVIASVGGPGETLAASAAHGAAVGAFTVAAVGRLIGEASCNLSSLDARTAGGCGVLAAVAAGGSASGVGVASAGGSLAAVASGGGPNNDRGNSPGGLRPEAPAPAPSPGPGGGSGASAGGGAGLGLAGFLSLAGLLGLAAPRAMRRLALTTEPWLAPSFALIPERPD